MQSLSERFCSWPRRACCCAINCRRAAAGSPAAAAAAARPSRPVLTLCGAGRGTIGEPSTSGSPVALLAVLAVHLFLHWKWVVCVVRGKATDRSGWRLGLGAIGLVALVLLAAAPWLSPTTQQTRAELRGRSGQHVSGSLAVWMPRLSRETIFRPTSRLDVAGANCSLGWQFR